MDSASEEIEYLARSDHRVAVLDALGEGPMDRRDLRRLTGASSPTMGRILGDFEDRHWIERNDSTYRLTSLGEFVARGFGDLRRTMTVERKLRKVWQWLPREMDGFNVEPFADAVVSFPGPGYPYEPVERMEQLVEETDRLAGFGTIVLRSSSIETICGVVLGGTEMEYVFAPQVLRATVQWDPERIGEVAACDNCTVLVHDGLPDQDRCGLVLVDDRVGLCCHDAETGGLAAVVDTDNLAARAWADSLYERYRDEATPVDPAALEDEPPAGA